MKGDDVGAINVADNDISPIDVSSVESADVLAETATKDSDAVAKAIAELPRRFRRDVGENSRLYPESWLARIDALLATDKREEAVANLRGWLPDADFSRARALASHPRIAEVARAAGFGHVDGCRPPLEDVVRSIKSRP